MDDNNKEGGTMAWRGAGDGESRDQFASATGTFFVHLFHYNGDKRGDTTQRAHKGEEMMKEDSGRP